MDHTNLIPESKPSVTSSDHNYHLSVLPSHSAHGQSTVTELPQITDFHLQQGSVQQGRASLNSLQNPELPQSITVQPSFISAIQSSNNQLSRSFVESAVTQPSCIAFPSDAMLVRGGQSASKGSERAILPKTTTLSCNKANEFETRTLDSAAFPAAKVRALRTAYSEMAKVERARTQELLLNTKDSSIERAVRKNIKLRRAAEKAELRAQLEAIQQNRYRPVYYYKLPVQNVVTDPTAEATTFNGRFRKIVPKRSTQLPQ
ncbi:hypothetical protein L0F63_003151, partial [Massospora cicadina]